MTDSKSSFLHQIRERINNLEYTDTRVRLVIWLILSAIVCAPSSVFLHSTLLGDPKIDVWNHAWGYWFVFQSIAQGTIPLETNLIGAPGGGSLYFIDMPGAIASLPLTAIFGASVAYNVVLLLRIAVSGLASQLLGESLGISTKSSWIVGLGAITLPFLLCELSNGISEVCAIQWGIFALYYAQLSRQNPQNKNNWLLLGLFQGLTISATFYYGLAFGVLLLVLIGQHISKQIYVFHREKDHEHYQTQIMNAFMWPCIAATTAIIVASPYAFTFWYSLQSDNRLVLRDTSLHDQLLRHNAVDPKIYLWYGKFQSVDLFKTYGEPFVHTAFLRWSLLPFALYAGWKNRDLRIWLFVMLLSLSMGLGNYVWWNGDWVYINGQLISLPFDWLRRILPQIAITHPLRLSIGGQIICICLGVLGWEQTWRIWQEKQPSITTKKHTVFFCMTLCMLLESLVFSSVQWPIPHANASISDIYNLENNTSADTRGVLDLPAEAGTSMETSQYFWFQSKHHKPIPYTPDARLGSTRDLATFKNFMGDGMKEEPHALSTTSILHMRRTYQLLVVHSNIDATKADAYKNIFTDAFGTPIQSDDMWIWYVTPLHTEEEKQIVAPQPENQSKSLPYSSEGETPKPTYSCAQPEAVFTAYSQHTLDSQYTSLWTDCGPDIAKYCVQKSNNSNITLDAALLCIEVFATNPSGDQQYALLHVLRHPDDNFVLQIAQKLAKYPNLIAILPQNRLLQLSSQRSIEVQHTIQNLFP